jgi:hypothetical protein
MNHESMLDYAKSYYKSSINYQEDTIKRSHSLFSVLAYFTLVALFIILIFYRLDSYGSYSELESVQAAIFIFTLSFIFSLILLILVQKDGRYQPMLPKDLMDAVHQTSTEDFKNIYPNFDLAQINDEQKTNMIISHCYHKASIIVKDHAQRIHRFYMGQLIMSSVSIFSLIFVILYIL